MDEPRGLERSLRYVHCHCNHWGRLRLLGGLSFYRKGHRDTMLRGSLGSPNQSSAVTCTGRRSIQVPMGLKHEKRPLFQDMMIYYVLYECLLVFRRYSVAQIIVGVMFSE